MPAIKGPVAPKNIVKKLEKIVKEFMSKWGPETQKRRDERDAIWDEMVRVVSIQKKNQDS